MSNITIVECQRSIFRTIIFNFYAIILIPSLLCSLFIFYNCIQIPQLRNHPPNRVVLILLVFLFIQALFDIPFRMISLYQGKVPIQNEAFCRFWYLSNVIINIIGLHLMALCSIERYILVFHHRFFIRYRFYVSTVPILICIIYPTVWYITIENTSWWCTYKPDYSADGCGTPCFLTNSIFHLGFVILTHHLLPVFITVFFNLALMVVIFHKKAKMKRNNSWRKNFRMTSQLLSIAFFYLIVWLPHCIFASFPLFTKGSLSITGRLFTVEYFANLTPIFTCLCPFISLIALSHLHDKIKRGIEIYLTCWKKHTALIFPETNHVK
ncbi:hypothetical protein I4U23_010692 [Adineta vaga]|nr:hypothetical protein I4U23_010692 [Adineta vaga]